MQPYLCLESLNTWVYMTTWLHLNGHQKGHWFTSEMKDLQSVSFDDAVFLGIKSSSPALLIFSVVLMLKHIMTDQKTFIQFEKQS